MFQISADVEGAEATYDVDGWESSAGSFVFLTFGRKRLRIAARNDFGSAERTVDLFVVGTFLPIFESVEQQHNAEWQPVTTAIIVAPGSYDEVRGMTPGIPPFAVGAAELYEVPIPFEGTRAFELTLFEAGEAVTDSVMVELTGLNLPPPKPSYEGPALLTITVGSLAEFEIGAPDPNDDPVRYEARPLPEGAAFDRITGVFSWTPGVDQIGYHLINFYAVDLPFESGDGFSQRAVLVTPQ